MNSLQLQCYLGGVLPLMNPLQRLIKDNLPSGNSYLFSGSVNNLNEVKVINTANNDTSTDFRGNIEVLIITIDGNSNSISANETGIFINTCESVITEIQINNNSNNEITFVAYS